MQEQLEKSRLRFAPKMKKDSLQLLTPHPTCAYSSDLHNGWMAFENLRQSYWRSYTEGKQTLQLHTLRAQLFMLSNIVQTLVEDLAHLV